jgi:hypothetical protein
MLILTATCENGEIHLHQPLPTELEGKSIRLTVQELDEVNTSTSPSLAERQAFLTLPITERRRILTAQAEAMADHYQQDPEWREWVTFDLGDQHDDLSETR